MYCDRNIGDVQRIDRNEFEPVNVTEIKLKEKMLKSMEPLRKHSSLCVEQVGFRVLPVYNFENPLYDKFLSLEDNPYLLKSWQQFLEERPKDFVKIRLYTVDKKMKEDAIQKSYRYELSGKFYDYDNKLAPSPMIPGRTASLRTFRKLNLKTRRL